MAKGATIMTVLGWDDSALKRGISSATSAVASLGRAISGSVGGAITTMHRLNGAVELVGRAFSGIKSVMDDVLMPAADMEQTIAAFDVLIGSAEESARVLKQLQQLGAKTPFEFPELAEAGKKLIAFGESSSEVAKTLRRIGDVSSAVQAPIGEIAEIYGKARVQGTLFAEDINQLTGRGIPVIQQFARQLGVTTGEVKKMASEGKVTFPMLAQAFRDMTGSGGQFAGMMEKQSATFKGMLSNLSDAWTQLKVAFGEPIIQSLKPALDELIKGVGNLKGMAVDTGKAIGEWVTYITNAFRAGSGMNAIWLDLQIGFTKITNWLEVKMMAVIFKIKAEFLEMFDKDEASWARKTGQTYEAMLKNHGATPEGMQALKVLQDKRRGFESSFRRIAAANAMAAGFVPDIMAPEFMMAPGAGGRRMGGSLALDPFGVQSQWAVPMKRNLVTPESEKFNADQFPKQIFYLLKGLLEPAS